MPEGEWPDVAVDRAVGGGVALGGGGDGAEHLTTEAVHAGGGGGAGGLLGAAGGAGGGAGDGQPIPCAGVPHLNHARPAPRQPRLTHGEALRLVVDEVCARCVADSTEAAFTADADRVVLVGEVEALGVHVVEALNGSTDASVVLQTALNRPVNCTTLYVGHLHLEGPLVVPGGDEGEGDGGVAGAGVDVHVLPRVVAADDGDRRSARYHKPDN